MREIQKISEVRILEKRRLVILCDRERKWGRGGLSSYFGAEVHHC